MFDSIKNDISNQLDGTKLDIFEITSDYEYNLTSTDIQKIYTYPNGFIFLLKNKSLILFNEDILKNNKSITFTNNENYILLISKLLNKLKIDVNNLNIYTTFNELYVKSNNNLYVFPLYNNDCLYAEGYLFSITLANQYIKNNIGNKRIIEVRVDTILKLKYENLDDIYTISYSDNSFIEYNSENNKYNETFKEIPYIYIIQ